MRRRVKKENATSGEGACLRQALAAGSLLTLACGVCAFTRVRPGTR